MNARGSSTFVPSVAKLNKRFSFTSGSISSSGRKRFNILNTAILGGPNHESEDVNFGFVAESGQFRKKIFSLGFKLLAQVLR